MLNQLFIKTTAITFITSVGLFSTTLAAKANSDFSSSHVQTNSSSIQQSGNSTSVHRSGNSSSRSTYSSESSNSTFNISLPKQTSTENSEDRQQPDATTTNNHRNSFGITFDDVDEYIRRQLSN